MQALISWISLIATLLPLVQQIITQIEALLPSAQGPQKKQIALDTLSKLVPPMQIQDKNTPAILDALIDNQVSFNNATGLFKKK